MPRTSIGLRSTPGGYLRTAKMMLVGLHTGCWCVPLSRRGSEMNPCGTCARGLTRWICESGARAPTFPFPLLGRYWFADNDYDDNNNTDSPILPCSIHRGHWVVLLESGICLLSRTSVFEVVHRCHEEIHCAALACPKLRLFCKVAEALKNEVRSSLKPAQSDMI
jgi:hypothetical protein